MNGTQLHIEAPAPPVGGDREESRDSLAPALRYLDQKWLRLQESLEARAVLVAQGGHSSDVMRKVDCDVRHALFMAEGALDIVRESLRCPSILELVQ